MGAVGCRAGDVDQGALQEKGTFPFSAGGSLGHESLFLLEMEKLF